CTGCLNGSRRRTGLWRVGAEGRGSARCGDITAKCANKYYEHQRPSLSDGLAGEHDWLRLMVAKCYRCEKPRCLIGRRLSTKHTVCATLASMAQEKTTRHNAALRRCRSCREPHVASGPTAMNLAGRRINVKESATNWPNPRGSHASVLWRERFERKDSSPIIF